MKVRTTLDPDTKDVILDYIFDDEIVRIKTNLDNVKSIMKDIANNFLAKQVARLLGIEIEVIKNEGISDKGDR